MIALTELPGTRRKAGPDFTSVTSPAPTKPQRTAPRRRRAAKRVTGRSVLLVRGAREADDLVGDVLDRCQHDLVRGLARTVGGDEEVRARGVPVPEAQVDARPRGRGDGGELPAAHERRV